MTRLPVQAKPFTPEHFAIWARTLTLDNGEKWVVEPFQLAFVGDVFAGYPECWLVIPEGNGKTTLCAGLALYFCEFSPQPIEIPVAASSREQAQILYRQAEGFILRSKTLHELAKSKIQEIRGKLKLMVPRFIPLPGHRRIDHFRGSRIQVQAADDRTGDGVIFRLAFIDELHRHRTLDLQRTWVGKIFKRGGQVVVISTAGEPASEFEMAREQIRQSATEVTREGCFVRAASPEICLHEWAVPEAGDVEDLELVAAANPFSRITVTTLASKRRGPTMTLQHWRRFTCNLPTRSDEAAIQEIEWAAARTTEVIPAGQPIWLGLDVAWKFDTTAAVPLWIRDDHFRLLGPATVIVPPRDGSSLDPALIERKLRQIHERNPIHTVVMDISWARDLGMWLERELGARVEEHNVKNEGAALDYSLFMEALRNGWLKHTGDRVLTSHVLNAVSRMLPDGHMRFYRKAQAGGGNFDQDRRVIDALMAAAMVHSTAVTVEPEIAFDVAFR